MAIEKKMVKSLQTIIFNIVSLLQRWMPMLSREYQEVVKWAIRKLKMKMGRLTMYDVSDDKCTTTKKTMGCRQFCLLFRFGRGTHILPACESGASGAMVHV
jgi:hypothetical protein